MPPPPPSPSVPLPPPPPTVVAVTCLVGSPASGKSLLASTLSPLLPSSTVLSYDAVESELEREGDGPEEALDKWRLTRTVALERLGELVARREPPSHILVDDTLHLRSMRKQLHRCLSSSLPPSTVLHLRWIHVTAPPAACAARNSLRGAPVTAATVARVAETLEAPGEEGRDGVPVHERGNVLTLDSSEHSSAKAFADVCSPLALSFLSSPSSFVTVLPPPLSPPPLPSSSPLLSPPSTKQSHDLLLRSLVKHAISTSACSPAAAAAAKKSLGSAAAAAPGETVAAFASLVAAPPSFAWSFSTTARSALAAAKTPFTPTEIATIVNSLSASLGPDSAADLDVERLADLVARCGHLSHKEWKKTLEYAKELETILGAPGGDAFGRMFKRVLEGGGWEQAKSSVGKEGVEKPWLVLVTGLNGIRKTTSIYQPFFSSVLKDALSGQFSGPPESLPVGSNSFFRQLDFMICSLAGLDFKDLYSLTDLGHYSARKASLFSRYRMLSEMLGLVLVKHAVKLRMNVMLETSGRDVAMFEYVDFVLAEANEDKVEYNKLAINFKINDIKFAEKSVDERMAKEMAKGSAVLRQEEGATLQQFIDVNMGGPYGSEVLGGVKEDSERVWAEVVGGEKGFGDWHKASVFIEGKEKDDKGGGGEWREKGGESGAWRTFGEMK